jgi:tetratricopeptide (TPR) repeat protein
MAMITTVTLCGCAGMADSMSSFLRTGPWWTTAQTGTISARARELEAHGELAMALDHWRLVERIAINPATAGSEITRLQGKITKAVKIHYQKGLADLREKKLVAARDHFLAALRLDPAFQPALTQINGRFSPFPLAVHLSRPGDQPATIAKDVFGDSDKAYLVAWFNDLPVDKVVTPGTLLILPKLEKRSRKKVRKKKLPNKLAQANALLAKDDLDGAMTLAKQANQDDPKVQELINTIYLKQAMAQISSGQLEAARPSLAKVPDGFAGKNAVVEALQAALQKQQRTLALEKARMYFDQGAYPQSLELLEKLLQEEPQYDDARDLATEARYRVALDLFDHQRFLEAREVLEKMDKNHEASVALDKTVRSRLADLAQVHYRKGVKHFINENLESAIAEWEIALACNPNHNKARKNIENARRLMQKIKALP